MKQPTIAEAKEIIEREELIADLRDSNNRLSRQLRQAKASQVELVDAVFRAARDSMAGLRFGPIPKPPKDARKKDAEIAIAILSDFQLAKVTPTYNSAICEERVEVYADKVLRLTEIQRADHPVKELRVWLLGDIVEGELIFPGQSFLIDASLYRQVTVDGPRILGNFLRRMLPHFEKINVVGVIGNHGSLGGRARRDYSPETNADRMLYRILETLFRDESRISWTIPDGPGERNWYAVDSIGSHSWLLCHGDQFRWGIKSPSAENKILGWRTGAIPEPFQEVVCGHWHNINSLTLRGGTTTLRVNGSTESYNTYAQEFIGSMSRPAQWLMFAHPNHGVTAEYRVWLD